MKKQIIGVLIVGVAFLGGGAFVFAQKSDGTQDLAVQTEKNVKVSVVGDTMDTAGFAVRGVVAGEQEVHLAPKASGRVTKLYVDIGDTVYKGQLLATIDGSEVWAQTQVAHSGVHAAQEAVKETKDYFADQVALAKKARSLAEDGYEAAKASGDTEKINEAKAQYELAKKSYEAAKSGRTLQVDIARGQQDIAQSQLIAAQTVAANTQLRAPFSGVIAARHSDVGALVAPTAPMFIIVQGEQKEVDLSVSPQDVGKVAVGDTVQVVSEDGTEGDGMVRIVSPMIDTQTRKGLVRIALTDDAAFTLGTYVDVIFTPNAGAQDAMEEKILVDRTALVPLYHDVQVFVVRDGIVHAQAVTRGEDYGQMIDILEGLQKGDQVVTEGQHYVRDGDRVTVMQ